MRLLVVGGGIAGTALALAHARQGGEAVVLERADRYLDVGAGVQVSPNASGSLSRLGVLDQVLPLAVLPSAVEVRSARDGAMVFSASLGPSAEARWGFPYLQLHRADLHRVLMEAAARTGRVEVQASAEVVEVGEQGAFAFARTAAGERFEGAALCGCDGGRSRVRDHILGPSPARFTGRSAWRGLVPADSLRRAGGPVAGVLIGPRRHFVHYRVRGGALVNFVAVAEGGAWRSESWTARGDPSELAAEFAGWPEPAPSLIQAAGEVGRWALFDRRPFERWSLGRIGLAGDAAHPMLPYLAQGAAMALEDGEALALAFKKEPSPQAALARFVRARRARTARVQAASRFNARLFHLPDAAARFAFRAAARLDRGRAEGARLDWLYGYDASKSL